MTEIIDITAVKTTNDYILEIVFSDGLQKKIDFRPFIKDGVSKQLLDLEMFNTVKVDFGTIVWQNGYDVCPVFLRNC
jgi:Protein of unknown function (DUF2442)